MRRTPKSAGGFTLMEMMVVIVVMGLLVSLLLTRGPPHSATLVLKAAAAGVAQNLRLARSQAIAGDTAVPFIIDLAHDRLGRAGALQQLPPGVGLTVAAGTAAGIIFEPDGSATGGTIGLASRNLRVAITVAWLTGQVDVSEVGAGGAK